MAKKILKKSRNGVGDYDQKSFLALAIHKLKTPISSMKLSLEMLLEGDFGELKEEQKKIVERIYQRNESLIDLVNDLFNLAKVNKNNTHKVSAISMARLIKLVIDYEQDEIQKKAIKVTFKHEEHDNPIVKADKEGIFLAIQNIVDNAIKYSNAGGEVVISLAGDSKTCRVVVADCGIGIRDSDKDKIFTEFFRSENAKEMHSLGSGLGLYIAKEIIESADGSIQFESKEHKGTAFIIKMPVA